jgi:hypothetical protein
VIFLEEGFEDFDQISVTYGEIQLYMYYVQENNDISARSPDVYVTLTFPSVYEYNRRPTDFYRTTTDFLSKGNIVKGSRDLWR